MGNFGGACLEKVRPPEFPKLVGFGFVVSPKFVLRLYQMPLVFFVFLRFWPILVKGREGMGNALGGLEKEAMTEAIQ